MSWLTDNAVKRIFNAFKRSKDKIYKEDIDALKLLNDELVNANKNYAIDNILFLKLLAIHLKTEVDYFRDINFAKQNINKALASPLSFHIEFLKTSLNEVDLDNYFKSIGIIQGSYLLSDDEKNNETIRENQKGFIEKLEKEWTYEKIEQSLYNTTNEFIRDIKNYK